MLLGDFNARVGKSVEMDALKCLGKMSVTPIVTG